MKLLNFFSELRNLELSEDVKNKVVGLGKAIETTGMIYRLVSTQAEMIGKALQTPESADEIFNCITDVKNRILDAGSKIVKDNEEKFSAVEKCADELSAKMEAVVKEETEAFEKRMEKYEKEMNWSNDIGDQVRDLARFMEETKSLKKGLKKNSKVKITPLNEEE